MKIRDVISTINGKLICGECNLDAEIFSACGSDLMSDVMAYVNENVILLTGLINPQVIRTAEMLDISAIVFVRGKQPTADMTALAGEKSISLICTDDTMFVACGKLYEAGVKGKGTRSCG